MNWDPELYEARHGFVWKFGEDLVEFLNPQKGERILDLGCGPGQLSSKIAELGAEVTGLDASPAMIGQARQNYPRLRFVLQEASSMEFQHEFDAVFSNAALHWMLDAQGVAEAISKALRKGGRLMAEMGGKGNIRQIERAIQAVLPRYYSDGIPPTRTYFPAVGEYASLLEANGLEVRTGRLFDRPTPLEGEDGMANWIKQFKWYYLEDLPVSQREKALAEVVEELRPVLRNADGWYVDYRRLRIHAVKV
jgi:trans-aconitate 2-methyltransferase